MELGGTDRDHLQEVKCNDFKGDKHHFQAESFRD